MNVDFKSLIGAKSFEELMTQAREKMSESSITNWNTGGVFKNLAALCMQGLADLYKLIYETILPNSYAKTAKGKWLDFIAEDVDVQRHLATKTIGNVKFIRNEAVTGAIKIESGSIVKTPMTAKGEELRYFVIEEVILEESCNEIAVKCQAEFEGAEYNVGQGTISILVTHINGISVSNDADWVVNEGTNEEDDESLRERYFLRWNELSTGSTALAYKSWARSVTGVLDVAVNDMHPRGQGTVDVIITSSDGVPTEALKKAVLDYIETKRPQCSDVLVKEPNLIPINITVELWLPIDEGDTEETIAEGVKVTQAMFVPDEDKKDISIQKIGRGFYNARLNKYLMGIDSVFNVVIASPVDDVLVESGDLISRNEINITVKRVNLT
ncbi:baseplate J/gp47 family protein [Anaerosinus gibii]|uniref:Baseplate J/gp47 family protein n=1 Tax=Selenobaculum gibii TaxID=3054208 RepID=A0A9Y2AI20_9FIRM|nr:baseplate J/gp47 family protein [Selenobaculum gbiensis]WIW70602.1 baseplate J/gp47 family protein [Selenobaculum gbiensis]